MIRALIVDDDFMVAELHQRFTERVPGFKVVAVCHSGHAALEAIERLRPDLVVLDIYLPDQSGLSVVHELRRRRVPVDVLVVTAAKDAESLQEAMQSGALYYIIKPFDFARFAETLERYRVFAAKRATRGMVGQGDVDRLYGLMAAPMGGELPKGLNPPTLELVWRHLRSRQVTMSAQEVAEGTGVSRGTARRTPIAQDPHHQHDAVQARSPPAHAVGHASRGRGSRLNSPQ